MEYTLMHKSSIELLDKTTERNNYTIKRVKKPNAPEMFRKEIKKLKMHDTIRTNKKNEKSYKIDDYILNEIT